MLTTVEKTEKPRCVPFTRPRRRASRGRIGQSRNREVRAIQNNSGAIMPSLSYFTGNAVVDRVFCKLVVNRVYGDYLCSVYNRLSLFAVQLAFSQLDFFFLTTQYRGNNDDQRKDFTRAWNESSRRSISACVWSETAGSPVPRIDSLTLNIFNC